MTYEQAAAATKVHKELVRQLLDRNIEKTEREHAAAKEIRNLQETIRYGLLMRKRIWKEGAREGGLICSTIGGVTAEQHDKMDAANPFKDGY